MMGWPAKRARAVAKAAHFQAHFLANPNTFQEICDILHKLWDKTYTEPQAQELFWNLGVWDLPQYDPADRAWLWNYLKNYNQNLAKDSDAKHLPDPGPGFLTW